MTVKRLLPVIALSRNLHNCECVFSRKTEFSCTSQILIIRFAAVTVQSENFATVVGTEELLTGAKHLHSRARANFNIGALVH